jgi:hypothetical protein
VFTARYGPDVHIQFRLKFSRQRLNQFHYQCPIYSKLPAKNDGNNWWRQFEYQRLKLYRKKIGRYTLIFTTQRKWIPCRIPHYYRFPVPHSFQMQSTTLCQCTRRRCHCETVLLPWQVKEHISMEEYNQRVRFNMNKYWLFTAGKWRSTVLAEDKFRLNYLLWLGFHNTNFTLFRSDVSAIIIDVFFKLINFSLCWLTSLYEVNVEWC